MAVVDGSLNQAGIVTVRNSAGLSMQLDQRRTSIQWTYCLPSLEGGDEEAIIYGSGGSGGGGGIGVLPLLANSETIMSNFIIAMLSRLTSHNSSQYLSSCAFDYEYRIVPDGEQVKLVYLALYNQNVCHWLALKGYRTDIDMTMNPPTVDFSQRSLRPYVMAQSVLSSGMASIKSVLINTVVQWGYEPQLSFHLEQPV